LQQKHAHIRGMLMPTKSAGLLKAASVFSLFHTYFDSLHKATAIRIFSDFIYNETEYFDLFLSAKRYFPDFGL
jgi:hypothetical protein